MDTCVCCGKYVPEGRQICHICESDVVRAKKEYERNSVDISIKSLMELEAVMNAMIDVEVDYNEREDQSE